MNNEELTKEITEQRKLIEQIYVSVEKTRRYIFWTVVATFVTFVLPMILLAFAIPYFTSYYSNILNSASLGL